MKLSVYMGSNLVGIDRYEVYDLFPNGDKIYINPLTFNEDFTACTTEVKYSFDIGDKVTSKFKLKINWFGENMIRPNVNTLMDQIFIYQKHSNFGENKYLVGIILSKKAYMFLQKMAMDLDITKRDLLKNV